MRFSIVITCFNQASFIQQAVASALAQTCDDKEIIVVDDGSTDRSRGLLEQYGRTIRFEPLKRNRGPAGARNAGALLAGGEFLVFLDGDDLLLPWALDVYGRIIELKSPKLILSRMLWFEGASFSVEIDPPPDEITVVDYGSFMAKDRPYRASASALVIDRVAFNDVRGWTKNIFPMDDHDLLIKLGYAGRTVQILSPPTTGYRVHASNTVHQIDGMIANLYKLIEREKLHVYPRTGALGLHTLGIIGGLVLFALKRAIRKKRYLEALKLSAAGWAMILAAVFLRCVALVRGRHPVETLSLPCNHPNAGEGAGEAAL